MKIIKDVGVSKIYQCNSGLCQRLLEGVSDISLSTLTPEEPDQRGSIVNIQLPNPSDVVSELQQQNFILDMRANGIRVSPHFFNSFDDIDTLLKTLKQR